MAAPSWPAGLPQKLHVEGQASRPANNTIRSSVDAGPSKVRRRSTAAVRPLTGKMWLKSSQRQMLEEFYTIDLASGALPFLFPDPHCGDPLLCRFAEDGLGFAKIAGNREEATLTLEILP